jgi:hypothetical protein
MATGLIDRRSARAVTVALLSVFLVACENKAARERDACGEQRHIFRTVVAAMCAPWSSERERALAEMTGATHDDAKDGSDPSETVANIAEGVSSEDCVKAGFADPGPKVIDPRTARRRQEANATVARLMAGMHLRKEKFATPPPCDLWAKDAVASGS